MEYTSKHYCITDSSLHVVQLNKWIPKTVGMAEEDFIGRSLLDTLKGVVVNVDECRDAMERALAGDASTVIVEENFKGNHKFFEILHMPVQFPDGSQGMMAVSQDVTDEKQREMALRDEGTIYRDLVEHLPALVFATDAGSLITYISPRIAELGLVPDTLYDRPFSDLAVPEDKTKVMAGLATALRGGAAGGIRFRLRAGKGLGVIFEADCVARYGASGGCAGINGILREIPGTASEGRKISRGK
jgi:PAS domain S-box-containing protein